MHRWGSPSSFLSSPTSSNPSPRYSVLPGPVAIRNVSFPSSFALSSPQRTSACPTPLRWCLGDTPSPDRAVHSLVLNSSSTKKNKIGDHQKILTPHVPIPFLPDRVLRQDLCCPHKLGQRIGVQAAWESPGAGGHCFHALLDALVFRARFYRLAVHGFGDLPVRATSETSS